MYASFKAISILNLSFDVPFLGYAMQWNLLFLIFFVFIVHLSLLQWFSQHLIHLATIAPCNLSTISVSWRLSWRTLYSDGHFSPEVGHHTHTYIHAPWSNHSYRHISYTEHEDILFRTHTIKMKLKAKNASWITRKWKHLTYLG